jgi:hypothetical protein
MAYSPERLVEGPELLGGVFPRIEVRTELVPADASLALGQEDVLGRQGLFLLLPGPDSRLRYAEEAGVGALAASFGDGALKGALFAHSLLIAAAIE